MEQETKSKMSREELLKWQEELYELEKYAVSGKAISEEQMAKNVKEFLDPNFLHNQLNLARTHKEKLLQKLTWIEKREQFLIKEIQKESNNKSS